MSDFEPWVVPQAADSTETGGARVPYDVDRLRANLCQALTRRLDPSGAPQVADQEHGLHRRACIRCVAIGLT